MSSTVNVTLQSNLTVIETFTGPGVSPGDNTVTQNQLNEQITLNSGTSPAATKEATFTQTLTSGAATIDLTALPGLTVDETVNGTGLKVQALKISNPITNANKIVVAQGASNPYRIDGATNWSIPIAPGQSHLFNLDGASDPVGSTHKNIDLAGTGSQALNVQVVLG